MIKLGFWGYHAISRWTYKGIIFLIVQTCLYTPFVMLSLYIRVDKVNIRSYRRKYFGVSHHHPPGDCAQDSVDPPLLTPLRCPLVL